MRLLCVSVSVSAFVATLTERLSDCLVLRQEERDEESPCLFFSLCGCLFIARNFSIVSCVNLGIYRCHALLGLSLNSSHVFIIKSHTHESTHNRLADKYASNAAAFEFEAILHVFDFHWLLFFVCSCCSCFSPSQVAPGQPPDPKKRSHGLVLPSGSLAASRVNGCARANFFLRELKVARWEAGPFSLLPTCLPAFLRATFITWFQLQLLVPKGAREYECVWVWVLSRHFYLRWWP